MGLGARELFFEVLDKPPEERERLLEDLRRDNPELHRRVRTLLEAHNNQGPLDWDLSPRLSKLPLPESAAAPPAPSGAVLGDYEILDELGSGGAGVVYRARHVGLNRIVALKFLRVGEFATEREVQRFRAEAEAVARLDHPNIVPVFEVGEIQGRHYFSMKLIEGGSLATESPALREDPRHAARLLVKTARAVHHAHRRGLLHRDLKPSNILLDKAGVPYVADFGVAKRIDSSESLTASGWICGTPAYMAPEQVNPSLGEVTVQTDVYAIGCILYEILAATPPFEGETAGQLFRNILEGEPPVLSSLNPAVPRDLETICAKCLDKSPERRYSSLAALADDLDRWLAHKPIQARKSSLPERLWLAWRRKPVVVSLAAAVALLVVVLALGASAASLMLRENLDRARRAETDARARLRASLIAQSRANRRSRSVGQREESLKLLAQAASIRPGGEIIDEAVSAFALTDLRPIRSWTRASSEISASFGPDLRRCAVGFRTGRIEIRSVATGRVEEELPGFGPGAYAMAFSADGRFLAAKYHAASDTAEGAKVRIWRLGTGEVLFEEPVAVSALEFDTEGRLVIGATDGRLLDVDWQRGSRREFRLPQRASRISFHPDGRRFAVSVGGDRLFVLDRRSGRPLKEFQSEDAVLGLNWSPDGRYLAVASGSLLRILDNVDWREVRRFEGHNAEIVRVLFSPTAPLLATYSWDGTSRIWNVETGDELLGFPAQVLGFSRDGRRLGFSTRDAISAWEVLGGDMLWTLYGHSGKSPSTLDLSPDDHWIASAGRDGVRLWSIAKPGPGIGLTDRDAGNVIFHPSEDQLFACTDAGLMRWRLSEEMLDAPPPRPELLLEGSCMRSALSGSGKVLALTLRRSDGDESQLDLLLVDPENGTIVRRLEGVPGMDRISLNPDGKLVALGNWHGDGVHVMDTRDGSMKAVLCQGSNSARGRFSPDGRWLVTATGSMIQVWDVATWSEVRAIARAEGSSNLAGIVAFTLDGSRLAVTPTEQAIELIEPGTWKSVATLEAPTPLNLADIAFSRTGARVAAAVPTNRIQIWELKRIQESLETLNLSEGPGALLGRPDTGGEIDLVKEQ